MSAERSRMTFGALLSALMADRNISRSRIASMTGVKRAAVGKWLIGVRDGDAVRPQIPTRPMLTNIILALELEGDERRMLEAAYLAAGQSERRQKMPRQLQPARR